MCYHLFHSNGTHKSGTQLSIQYMLVINSNFKQLVHLTVCSFTHDFCLLLKAVRYFEAVKCHCQIPHTPMFGSMKQKTGCGKKRKKKKERKKGNLKQHIIMCIQEMPTPSEFHHVCSKGFFFPFFKLTSFRHSQALPNNTYSVIPILSYASGEFTVAVVILLLSLL